jgi:predicted nucleic acid-binding protein
MTFVLDASVALRWLLASTPEPDAEAVMARVVAEPKQFAVPELFPFECFSVLSRLHPRAERAWRDGVEPVLNSGVERYPFTDKLLTAALPFVKQGLTGYDASYAALAKLTNGTWLTYDKAAHHCIEDSGISFLLGAGLPSGL